MNSPLVGIKSVFFDLDDTLCGYWDASKRALRETFEKFAKDGHDASQMLDSWAAAFREFSPTVKSTGWYQTYLRNGGTTRTEQMRLTLDRLGIIDADLARELSDSYGFLRNKYLALFDDAIEVLETLKSRFPLGLITNGPADIQREEIETLGIAHYFEFILIEGELGEGKPNLSVFRHAECLSNCKPDELVFVGNSYGHDVRPAIDAGWKTVWIRRPSDVAPSRIGQKAEPEKKPVGAPDPDFEITNLSELLPVLGSASLPS